MPDYSTIVRFLRLAVPGTGIFLLVLFFLWPAITQLRLPHIDKAIIRGDRTELVNPRYEGKDDNGQRYVITAQRAVQLRASPDQVELQQPTAQLENKDNTLGPEVSAAAGVYQNKTSQLALKDGVTLVTPQGDTFKTPAADVDLKNKTIDVKQPVSGGGPTLDLSGQGLHYDQDDGLLTVTGPAKLVLHEKTDAASAPAAPVGK